MVNMKSKILFSERTQDINEYFSFIKLLIDKKAKLSYENNGETKNDVINKDMTHILKANAFIILYNLIESTISNAIEDIHEVFLNEEELCIDTLHENITKIAFKNIDTNTINNTDFSTGSVSKIILQEWLKKHKNDIKSNKNSLFSGNVDAKKIREIAEKYGFSSETDKNITKNGKSLVTIKQARNSLSHGSDSFRDRGREISIDELSDIKIETCHYLNKILDNIQIYLESRAYLRNSSASL